MALPKNFINNQKYNFAIFIFLIITGSATLIFWPSLFNGKIINDFFGLDLAHYKFTADFSESVNLGSLKLWWQNYLGGFPVYLTQIGFLNPLVFILSKLSNGFLIYNWINFLNFVLAGLAMYWFARSLLISKIAAGLSAISYMLSQNNLYWGATLPFTNVYIFIPLFLMAVFKISKPENNIIKWLIFSGLISAYGLAAGETQIVFFTFIVGFFWAVFLCFRNRNYGSKLIYGKKLMELRLLLGYIIIIFSGIVLSSFWLLPVLNYLKFTTRSAALSFGNLAYDFMRAADPLRFFYPYISLPQFTGFESLGIIPNYYVGALTFFLAVAAVFLMKKNKTIAFWTVITAFSFLIRIKYTGIFWLLHFLPGFDRFRGVFHWSFISSFTLALLAGFALDNFERIKDSMHFKKFISALKIFGLANIILAIGIAFTGLFRNNILNKFFQFFDAKLYPGKQLPLAHYHSVVASEFNKFVNAFSFTDYHFLISFLSVITAISLFVLYQKGKINFENFKKSALIFTFLNLVLIWQGYYSFILQPKIIDYPDTVKFIKNYDKSGKPYRFFRFYPPESYQTFEVFNVNDWTDYKLKTLESNTGVYFDTDTFGGIEPFLSARIADVFDEIGFERPSTISAEPWLRSTKLSLNDKISRFSSPQNINLLSMLNIKYIFSSFKLPNLKLVYQTSATEKNIPVYIYENSQAMPRVYFAKNVKLVESNNVFEELLKVKDFHDLTLIECSKGCSDQIPSSKFRVSGSITIKEFQPQLVKIKIKINQNQWLVYSDANLPTWEAYIDNQKIPIHTADYLFKSVFVTEGEHEIMFKYPGLGGQDIAAIKSILDLR